MNKDLLIKNYATPITLITILPFTLFKILLLTNTSNENSGTKLIPNQLIPNQLIPNQLIPNQLIPNQYSIIFLFSLLTYGYASIKFCKKKFIGNINMEGIYPVYAANGFEFWYTTTILITIISIYFKNFPTIFVDNFIPFISTANIFGLLFVTYLYNRDKNTYFDREEDKKLGYNYLFKFYRGLKNNPIILDVDVKQLTNCRFGMISWQIIILLFFFHYSNIFEINYMLFSTTFLQTAYIGKFFYWETGYFNTLDITLDRGGYYICWGCLVFIPSFYTYTNYYFINTHPIENSPTSFIKAGICIVSGLYFLYKNYEVDWQKTIFRKYNENTIINGKKCKFLNVKYKNINNEIVESKLLLSGHWGHSRHMNYTYEILLSLCWSAGNYNEKGLEYNITLLPFLYLFYIIILLIHRIYRDEDKCKKKYGEYWDIYCNIVKYRLVKYIY